jgi:sugar/nucleoside kinase (ribokinase family)
MLMRKVHVAAVGYTVIDYSYQIASFDLLPRIFAKYTKRSIPFSKVPSLFGKEWNAEKVKDTITHFAKREVTGVFSGRAINIGFQIARLGGSVELITEVGEDFNSPLPMHKLSYADHLKTVGINVHPFSIEFPENMKTCNSKIVRRNLLQRYGHQLLSAGVIMPLRMQTASVISISDYTGADIFFFDDVNSASEIARFRPIPVKLLEKLDAVIVSSGDRNFNQLVVNAAYKQGLQIFFDVGLFEPSPGYFRNLVSKSTIIFGNPKEINEVCKAFGCPPSHPEQIFLHAKSTQLKYIVMVEKEMGKVSIFQKDPKKTLSVGPLIYKKSGTSVGVCDAITGGTIALYLLGYPIDISCRGGLVAGGAVWESDKIQEPMVDWEELIRRYAAEFGESL